MKRKSARYFGISGLLFLGFVVFTVLVAVLDVQAIGPEESEVGFSTLNQFFFRYLGGSQFWYRATEWVGVIAILVMALFAVAGLGQLIRYKTLRRVDGGILLMGILYVLLIAAYALFEVVVINYRPVLVNGCLEASYPSSHTVLIFCVMTSAAMYIHLKFPRKKGMKMGADLAAGILSVGTVVGRLLSGVHWFTDIAGAILLSAALFTLYRAGMELLREASVKT